jgi:hypothetical protein
MSQPEIVDPLIPPNCPACGDQMQVAMIYPASREEPETRVYRCRGCGVAETEIVWTEADA